MVVVTAAEPVGSIVLPENVVQFTSNVTATAPCEGMGDLEKPHLYCFIGKNSYGTLFVDHTTSYTLHRLADCYSSSGYELHAIRPVGKRDPWVFYDEDFADSLEVIPWTKHLWFKNNFRRWAELLPRPSVKYPGLVSYFQTPEKRGRNIRTPIKPGRFLKKFFGDILTEVEIHEYAAEWSAACEGLTVRISQDADEIERIYQGHYLGSCMQFPHDTYDGNQHPARVYAGPDLGIAYLGSIDCVDARVLVWPTKKIYYGRKVYGDVGRLTNALKDMGYASGGDRDFRGARIQRIPYDDMFILPYLDCASTVGDDGDYLIVGKGYIPAQDTDGLSGRVDRCEDCDDAMGPDDGTRTYSGRLVCEDCLSSGYFRCEELEEYVSDDDQAATPPEYQVSTFGVQRSNWTYCTHSELYYPSDDMIELFEGGECAEEYTTNHGFYCSHTEHWSLEVRKALKLTNGEHVHIDSFSDRAELDEWLIENDVGINPGPDQIPLPFAEAA